MPIVSQKRQITLPVEQCKSVGIEPGDEVVSFVYQGQITLVKKVAGSAQGILSHIRPDKSLTDDQSLLDAIH